MGASRPRRARLRSHAKRVYDFVIAAFALIVLAPVMALIALCVVIESRGPVFYRAPRVGYRGALIYMLKFRKMHHGAGGRPLTLDGDERFTRIGGWLARTKLDELPQLINVLRGQMSLVGPRPEDPEIVQQHRDDFAPVLHVRPGITGLSQLAFATEGKVLDPVDPLRHYEDRILPQKLGLDALYAEMWRPALDLRILWWTAVTTVLRIPVAVNRSTGRMTLRRRPTIAPAPAAHRTVSDHLLGSAAAAGASQFIRLTDSAPELAFPAEPTPELSRIGVTGGSS